MMFTVALLLIASSRVLFSKPNGFFNQVNKKVYHRYIHISWLVSFCGDRSGKIMDTDPDQIIECVKKYPVLYDLKFQRTNKRKQAWVEVAKELNLDVKLVQKKWKNIKDEYVKYLNSKSKSKAGPLYTWRMTFMDPYLPSIFSNSSKRDNTSQEEIDSKSDDDEYDSPTRAPAILESQDNMNGLDLIFLGVSKLMKKYPQELAEAPSSLDEVDQMCKLISKVVKKYAQSEPHLVMPKITKFLMEQLANNNQSTSKEIKNEVELRPLSVIVKKETW